MNIKFSSYFEPIQHIPASWNVRKKGIPTVRRTNSTILVDKDKGEIEILRGSVKQRFGEEDNPTLGKKYAFQNALKNINNKTYRTQLWDNFFKSIAPKEHRRLFG